MAGSKLLKNEVVLPLFDKILERISSGEIIKAVLKDQPFSYFQFQSWLEHNPTYLDLYKRAQYCGAHSEVDDLLSIADDPNIDAQRARNMIDVRKWRAAKRNPNVYADRVDVNVNQTVDIGGALAEAMNRTTLGRHLNNERIAQPIDIPAIEIPKEPDCESVFVGDADIFKDEDTP